MFTGQVAEVGSGEPQKFPGWAARDRAAAFYELEVGITNMLHA